MRLHEFLNLTDVSEFQTYPTRDLIPSAQNPESIYTELIRELGKCSVGPYCWFVLDHPRNHIHSLGGMVEHLTNYTEEKWLNIDLDRLLDIWHPEDRCFLPFFAQVFQDYLRKSPYVERPFIKPDLYCRMQDSKGSIRWVSLQFFCHFEVSGLRKYTLYVIQDVSHLKKDTLPMMMIRNTYYDKNPRILVCEAPIRKGRFLLTARECEVLGLLTKGLCSKQIAAHLGISKYTVENHRQNMLRKTHTQCTTELVAMAIRDRLF
ncbi:MAG: LuxR C-terminal-related transcriptional regulator [Microscillaceae bacterium]|nr:LuxR C-terminal-related transcriptional regulator [Microscillaceae bacterium]